jgi:hypothetical protein
MTTRRDVLRTALAGMALGALPGWLATAVAGTALSQDALTAAYRSAAERGRPLLVVVVPPYDSGQGWDRGRLWGAVLNHGDDATLSALATAHLACADLEALRSLVPDGVPDDAWVVRIDTDQVPATHDAFGGDSPRGDVAVERFSEGWQEQEESTLDAQMAWLSGGLRELLLPSSAHLARYAAVEEAAQPADAEALGSRLALGETPSASLAARFPAMVALAASQHPAHRATLVSVLASAARAEWVEERVPGSWWARSHGCGFDFEDHEERFGVGCGMGYVPARASRMLHFYGPEQAW